ncbi:MAG: TetR/AcrR family transcriptional regulator [Cyanobacteria bacterium J06598_3]
MGKSEFRRQPQQKRSQVRVEQILKAAAEVFWEDGYDGATTHAIASRANTAVGTLYRFFPNKLALFHELEKRHRQGIEFTQTQMMTPEFMQKSLPEMVQEMVETWAQYFEDLGHRVVYMQYYVSPEMFVHFDDTVDGGFIHRFAGMLRFKNAALSTEKSELVAEVCHRSFNTLLLAALRSDDGHHRAQLFQELQTLLTSYLQPHVDSGVKEQRQPVEKRPAQSDITTADHISARVLSLTQDYRLNPRQQIALGIILTQGDLSIQGFETLCPERSRRTLQRDLKQLIAKGLVQSEGDTTQLVYRLHPNQLRREP